MDAEVWRPFLAFSDRGSAEAVAAVLEAEAVPTRIVAGQLVAAVEAEFVLAVPASLAHRARWMLASSDVSERELDFLATGELPGRS